MSQESFAARIDMDRTYYASLEAGRRNVAVLNLHRIAEGFDLTLSELFEGVGVSNGE